MRKQTRFVGCHSVEREGFVSGCESDRGFGESNPPSLPERFFSPRLDFSHSLHRLERGRHELSRIPDRDVTTFLEFKGGILRKGVNIRM